MAAGFVSVKVNVVVPYTEMLVGLKAAAMVGGATAVRAMVPDALAA